MKKSRLPWALALVFIAVAAGVSGCSSDSGPCGPAVKTKSGTDWVCTFADDFDGTSLDRAKWQVATTSTIGFAQGGACYVDDPEHVAVADGVLRLTARRLQGLTPCRHLLTRFQSGMVFSKDRFAQTYGRFEVRAKLPRGRGFQPALWMYPQRLTYGRRSGEIDIAESFGYPNLVSPRIHMRDAAGVDHSQGANCHVDDPSGEFHTYTVEWEPSTITFYYDGKRCLEISPWRPRPPLVAPQPFDQPFFMLLQISPGYGANTPGATTPFPGVLEVDYVRAWR